MRVTQSCLTLCDPMDYSPPGSSVPEVLQARILEWVAISFSRGSSQPRDQTWVSCTAGQLFTLWATREAYGINLNPSNSLSHMLPLRVCSPVSSSLWPYVTCDSSVHGILQARIMDWVAMPSSKGSSQLRDQTHHSYISWISRWVL